ncbi:hypothetical protein L211DRAFT_869744 [Terfezia boudieri ATCC MYA-4762]|uniref:Uncharacterized protein n=1 Tax=Terfezia boudieri ATCC MYA-4762 TaxID=1051890 RepID=A0A3N4LFQ1_9PEZI|nr:hypothetical protein L211DRAFT_869744 [Terfezia boudieri ATCC MYA-4762]
MPYRLPPATPRPTRPSQLPASPPPQIKCNPPRPIAITSPLLTYIWSLHQHYREHNNLLAKLHCEKNAAFANALNVHRTERRPQPGDFKYSLYGPFGKHYGQIVKLHAWKGAEMYWGECMLRIWNLVKYQAWAAQQGEKRMGIDERRLREEEERAWEEVDMFGEMRKNLKKEIDTGGGWASVPGGTAENLDWERKFKSSNPTRGTEFSSDEASAYTDKSAPGPSVSTEATVEGDADSSGSSLAEGPELLPSWAQPFVDRDPTYSQNLNYSDLPSWAIPVIKSSPQESPPSSTSSNIPLSLYSPFHQHHTTPALDVTPMESTYPASHILILYHHVLTNHPTLSQATHDSRTLPFLRGPPDLISTSLRHLRFNSFDFFFRAALRRHIGKARWGLDAVKEKEDDSKTRKGVINEEEPEKWGRWSQWEEMVVEGEISPPGLGRFRGYMGQKLWRLKNPGKEYYSAPITQHKDRKPERARMSEGKENWVQEALMGTTELEPLVEAEPIHLAPGLEKALDVLFEKPRGKAHDAAPVATVVEDKSEAAGLPKVKAEPVELKRPIHEEFNEVARAGREHLSLKRESKVSTITNVESQAEKMDVKSVKNEGISASMAEHKQEEDIKTHTSRGLEMENKHMEHERGAMNSNTTQDNRARESGAEWFSGVFQDVPTPPEFTFRRRRTGRNTWIFSRPPFLATEIFPPKLSKTSSLPPRSDPAASAASSPLSQNPSHPGPAENSFKDWAIKTGLFKSPEDRVWVHVDPRTKPPAPRSDSKTRWTVHLAEQVGSSGGQEDENEDMTALQRELELARGKINKIQSNEWWKRNEWRQVGSVDIEAKPRTAPDGLWGEGRRDWRKKKKVSGKKG